MAPPKHTNKKPPLTHFLCLPVLTTSSIPQLQESLSRFKQLVTHPARSETPASEDAEANTPTTSVVIPEKAFRPLGVLHLTLGVMSLRSEEKMNQAKSLLEGLDLSALLEESGGPSVERSHGNNRRNENNTSQAESDPPPPEPSSSAPTFLETLVRPITPPFSSRTTPKTSRGRLFISLRGLQAFPNPRKATVLHCPPYDPTSRLYPFCVKLKQRFMDAGLIEPEKRPLVLHATIVNTVYAKANRRHKKRRMGSITFDATEIMRTYNEKAGSDVGGVAGEFVWAADILLDRVTMCEMGARPVEDTIFGEAYAVYAERMINL